MSSSKIDVMEELREKNIVIGWRNELYPVASSFGEDPLFLLERAAALTLGIKAYGVHVNGYVMKDGEMFMWVAKRSPNKPTWPGKLDQIVAGGQPFGVGLMENVIKECDEEAGIPLELAKTAKPAGAVSYAYLEEVGFKQDVLFVYDLLLPEDFIPTPTDGEVEEFTLRPISEVVEIILTTMDYKPNCALVIIDFFIRHGIISPDQNGYLELLKSVRNADLV
eukprot:g5257.t1